LGSPFGEPTTTTPRGLKKGDKEDIIGDFNLGNPENLFDFV
jgi:hypothetical protein